MAIKAPFPYMGGKSTVAPLIWQALGQPDHYIEPCFGSGAVLLARPNYNPRSHTETVNDADGHIANVWRSLQADPDAVAKYCDWPVNHADLSARKRVLVEVKGDLLQKLVADPDYYDPKIAGYWVWCACCWIGSGMTRLGSIPHLTNSGQGVHAAGQIADLTSSGQGVHAIGKIPYLGSRGVGVHAAGQIADSNPSLDVREPYNTNIYSWFRQLSERLRHVRVVCGDWSRVCGGDWQDSHWNDVGIFFDPPYAVEDRDDVYDVDDFEVAHKIRAWAIERGSRPSYRIVIAGYEEHKDELLEAGWSIKTWKASGGYGNIARGNKESRGKANRHRECLYFSPHCLNHTQESLI